MLFCNVLLNLPLDHGNEHLYDEGRSQPAERSLPSSLGQAKAACTFPHLPGFADLQMLGAPEIVKTILVTCNQRQRPQQPRFRRPPLGLTCQRIEGTWSPNVNDFRINQNGTFRCPMSMRVYVPEIKRRSFDSRRPRPAGLNEKCLGQKGNKELIQDIVTKARIKEDPKA